MNFQVYISFLVRIFFGKLHINLSDFKTQKTKNKKSIILLFITLLFQFKKKIKCP